MNRYPILWTAHAGFTLAHPTLLPLPSGAAEAGGLAVLLDYARSMTRPGGGDVVFLIDRSLFNRLGLRTVRGARGQHDVLLDIPGADRGPVHPWITYRHERGRMHVGFLPWIADKPADHPLLGDLAAEHDGQVAQNASIARQYLTRLQWWSSLMGTEYAGVPGVAGVDLLRSLYDRGNSWAPRWHYAPPILVHEPEITRWASRHHPGRSAPRIVLDANRAYLAAMGTAGYCPGALTESGRPGSGPGTGSVTFDPSRAGFWQISAEPWPYPDRMPDPLCRTHQMPAQRFWVTTPTLQLWDQLTQAGHVAGYTVHAAWTGPGRRILRDWANRVDTAFHAARLQEDDDKGPLNSTVKGIYRQTNGMFNHEGGRIYRPDWHYTTVGQAKATLLRKVWKHGTATGEWPVGLFTDALLYSPDVAYHHAATCEVPRCPILHEDSDTQTLGTFKIKPTGVRA